MPDCTIRPRQVSISRGSLLESTGSEPELADHVHTVLVDAVYFLTDAPSAK